MPALAKPPVSLPRFVPHVQSGVNPGAGSEINSKSATHSESSEQLAHDARNVLSGLMLYCELLALPDVLTKQHAHYAQELQSIAKNTAQIVERLAIAQQSEPISGDPRPQFPPLPAASFIPLTPVPVSDAAEELRHLQPLLSAIAGPAIRLSLATMPCSGRTALAVEDLTRILINLVRNAADALPAGGHVRITAQYGNALGFLDAAPAAEWGPPRSIVLTVADDGPGIPESLREQIFETGFSTRAQTYKSTGHWPTPRRRGLGLSIVRNLVEAAEGTVTVAPAQTHGTRFEIRLPLTSDSLLPEPAPARKHPFPADSGAKGRLECQ